MDSECEWNQKNKHRPAEFIGDTTYAESPSQFVSNSILFRGVYKKYSYLKIEDCMISEIGMCICTHT